MRIQALALVGGGLLALLSAPSCARETGASSSARGATGGSSGGGGRGGSSGTAGEAGRASGAVGGGAEAGNAGEPAQGGTGGTRATGGTSGAVGGESGAGAQAGAGEGGAAGSNPDADADGDGWTIAQGDCNDHDPLVNPGSFDVPDNGIDDDCRGGVDDQPACDMGLASDSTEASDFAKAMDLCRTATLSGRDWGLIDAKLSLADGTGTPSTDGHAIRPRFGGNLTPRVGSSFAVLSTGVAAAMGDTKPGYVGGDSFDQGLSSSAPQSLLDAHSGSLPNAPGCPAPGTSTVSDPEMLTLSIRVPDNARSFSFETNFYSYEYPEWLCSSYSDLFVALLDSAWSGTPANPADGDVAVYDAGSSNVYPVGANLALDTGVFRQCVNGDAGCQSGATATITSCTSTDELSGTGFDDAAANECNSNSLAGGATGWLNVAGNVQGGEVITLRLAVWDTGDGTLDSTVVLDGFAWSTDPVTPGATPD